MDVLAQDQLYYGLFLN